VAAEAAHLAAESEEKAATETAGAQEGDAEAAHLHMHETATQLEATHLAAQLEATTKCVPPADPQLCFSKFQSFE